MLSHWHICPKGEPKKWMIFPKNDAISSLKVLCLWHWKKWSNLKGYLKLLLLYFTSLTKSLRFQWILMVLKVRDLKKKTSSAILWEAISLVEGSNPHQGWAKIRPRRLKVPFLNLVFLLHSEKYFEVQNYWELAELCLFFKYFFKIVYDLVLEFRHLGLMLVSKQKWL